VLGKGAPVYYLNGRKVRDQSLIDNLPVDQIKSLKIVAMPHLVIETTANLGTYPKAQALKELAASLTAHPQIPVEADLKIRFVDVTDFVMGTAPEPRGFVHAELRLLSGRTPEAKSELAARVLEVLQRLTPRPAGVSVQLSVEVRDMDRAPYAKARIDPQ
jgi:5-carboxymethyl-2-hydroxymuconate isomerase